MILKILCWMTGDYNSNNIINRATEVGHIYFLTVMIEMLGFKFCQSLCSVLPLATVSCNKDYPKVLKYWDT